MYIGCLCVTSYAVFTFIYLNSEVVVCAELLIDGDVLGRGRGRGRGLLGAPKAVNVLGGMGRGLGGLGGVGRGQPKAANKPLINMGKPPTLRVSSEATFGRKISNCEVNPESLR